MALSFTSLHAAGFTDLVCVIPPGAQLSPMSKIPADQAGKAPGRPNMAGQWGGYDWIAYEPTPRDLASWDRAKANIGLKASAFPAVDIDVTDPGLAEAIEREVVRALGPAPRRVGRAPKALLMYRASEPFGRRRLRFKAPDGVEHLIEVLGRGQQYVLAGTHPATRAPYELTGFPARPAELVEISAEKVDAAIEAVAAALEMLGCEVYRTHSEGLSPEQRAAIDQQALRAPSLNALAELMAKLPNTEALFPGRDQYVAIGYAVKAAGADDEGRAFDIFLEWALRWPAATEADVQTDWQKMKPPFSVGWDFLLSEAARAGLGAAVAQEQFEADEAPPAPSEGDGPPVDRHVGPAQWSEMAMANRCVRAFGDEVRFVIGAGWYVWDGRRWLRDEAGDLERRIGRVLQEAVAQAIAEIDNARKCDAVTLRLSSAATVAAVKRLLLRPALCMRPDDMDPNDFLLNTPAGVVDLTTGDVTEPAPALLMTRQTAVVPKAAPARRWLQFLTEATGGDPELLSYLQRLAGYALTGSTREHMVAFLYGDGGNGKSLFLNTLGAIMGDYAQTAPMDVFVASTYDRHPTDLAGLVGARLVTASETQEGRRWDEAKLKLLTGGDPVKARFMRQDFFTFQPRFTLLFAGNHAPQLATVDAAMKRRMHLVPFTNRPAQPDPELPDKLREEHAEILNWAIEGAQLWLRHGLQPPDVVLEATEEYLQDEDALGRFLADRCVRRDAAWSLTKNLYDAWVQWCHESGERAGAAWSTKRFSQAMKARGFAPHRDSATGLRGFAGVELLVEDVATQRAISDFAGVR